MIKPGDINTGEFIDKLEYEPGGNDTDEANDGGGESGTGGQRPFFRRFRKKDT